METSQRLQLHSVAISGFKSFENFELVVRPLTVIIGSNGAGKSNLIEALDFLSGVYRSGLQEAVDEAGGFDDIARRTATGTESRISFAVVASVNLPDYNRYRIRHSFTISSENPLEISVYEERLEISDTTGLIKFVTADRTPHGLFAMGMGEEDSSNTPALMEATKLVDDLLGDERKVERSKLFFPAIAPFSTLFTTFTAALSSTRLFEIDAELAREDSDKSYRPELGVYGQDLPSFLEWLQQTHPEAFARVEAGFREILPSLDELKVIETHKGIRSVRFDMQVGPNPLFPNAVSNGTIKYLVLLAAMNDPRTSLLLLEEPENSLHPWLINRLSESILSANHGKTIVLTTHSPQFLRTIPRESIHVMWNRNGSSQIAQIDALAPELTDAWARGDLDVFESIESGAISEYLPHAG